MPNIPAQFFSLETSQKCHQAEIVMRLKIPFTSTNDFPQTKDILEKFLPTIYNHKCLNGEELPFSEEVCETEIGHLFEHIVMEYLHQIKTSSHHKTSRVRGETIWDWNKEERGVFHILLDSPKSEANILSIAVSRASKLMAYILAPVNGQLRLSEKPLQPTKPQLNQ